MPLPPPEVSKGERKTVLQPCFPPARPKHPIVAQPRSPSCGDIRDIARRRPPSCGSHPLPPFFSSVSRRSVSVLPGRTLDPGPHTLWRKEVDGLGGFGSSKQQLLYKPRRRRRGHALRAEPLLRRRLYRGYWKLRPRTAVGSYSRARPRSRGPPWGQCVSLLSSNPCIYNPPVARGHIRPPTGRRSLQMAYSRSVLAIQGPRSVCVSLGADRWRASAKGQVASL